MLRLRIAIGFVAAALIALAGAAVAHWTAHQAHQQLVRGQAGDAVLDGLLEVSMLREQILRAIERPEQAGWGSSLEFSGRIDRVLSGLKQSILQEIAIVDDRERATEVDELGVVLAAEDALRQALRLLDASIGKSLDPQAALARARELLDGEQAGGLKARLDVAVAEERAEIAEANRDADGLLARLRFTTWLYAVIAASVILGVMFDARRRLRRPFQEVVDVMQAVKDGDLSRRMRIDSRDEFGLIAASFNAMADDRETKRDALLEAQASLERTVVERTEELRAANDALTAADASRRQLFADISHELRTPITAIRGEAEVALRGGTKPVEEYKAALNRVATTCIQLGRLVEDLLFIARADAGAHRMKFSAVSLSGLLESVCHQGRALASGSGISVELQRISEDVSVLGDPDRLSQLFLILLDNAIRYSDPNATVRILSLNTEANATVKIIDEGIGIPASQLGDIFRRFQRGENAMARSAQGLGLGLPIAKAIVEGHGGSIDVTSNLRSGTTVTVSLPVTGRLRAVA